MKESDKAHHIWQNHVRICFTCEKYDEPDETMAMPPKCGEGRKLLAIWGEAIAEETIQA